MIRTGSQLDFRSTSEQSKTDLNFKSITSTNTESLNCLNVYVIDSTRNNVVLTVPVLFAHVDNTFHWKSHEIVKRHATFIGNRSTTFRCKKLQNNPVRTPDCFAIFFRKNVWKHIQPYVLSAGFKRGLIWDAPPTGTFALKRSTIYRITPFNLL